MEELIKKELTDSAYVKSLMAEETVSSIVDAVDLVIKALRRGGKILLFGNGGSAADAQHIACELIGKFKKVRSSQPAIALTTDTSVLTSVANDFGYEFIFSRQIEAIANSEDVVIAISTSGNSPNVLEGVKAARDKGCKTIALTGRSGGKLAQIVDIPIRIPSNETARIQEAHITVGHIICAMVEKAFFGES
jgi:D-sedoheptulose 7-phosphate isomerase